MSDDLVKQICEAWVNDGLANECFWEGWPDCPTQDSLTPKMVLDCIEALEAQLAAREWQPIETAPREDTQAVLVFTPEGMEVAWWCDHQNELLTTDGKYLWGIPTHWMPLPEPPKAD